MYGWNGTVSFEGFFISIPTGLLLPGICKAQICKTTNPKIKKGNKQCKLKNLFKVGCVPLKDKGDYNGWFCPCHGSHYDVSGRVRKGPAPTNMEIPKFEFLDNNTIKIG